MTSEIEPAPDSPHLAVLRIEPRRGLASLRLRELWDARELVSFLAWRDIKVRYKQTALGAAWAIVQPVMTMIVFSVFFGKLAHLPTDGVPYQLFSFAAVIPWTMFATGLSGAAGSLIGNTGLLKKVYLPRLSIPLAAVIGPVVDFAVAFVVLLGMTFWYGIIPGPQIVLIVPLTLLAVLAALGSGIWLAALNVRYRDVKYVLPFLVQLWMFATPVAYSSSMIKSSAAHAVYAINPMVGVVDGFRYALLGARAPELGTLAISTGVALVIFLTGILYFRQTERTFADVI